LLSSSARIICNIWQYIRQIFSTQARSTAGAIKCKNIFLLQLHVDEVTSCGDGVADVVGDGAAGSQEWNFTLLSRKMKRHPSLQAVVAGSFGEV